MPDTAERIEALWWAGLVARVLHPVQVEIVEALKWIERPLSAADLSELFDRKPSSARVDRHIRRLCILGAIELSKAPTNRNTADIRYRLVPKPRNGL